MIFISDFHHLGLYESLTYLLEERLGHTLYRPIGLDWYTHGYWKINNLYPTALQYLSTDGYEPFDGTPPLNTLLWKRGNIYHIRDPHTQQIQKALELKTILDPGFHVDAFICSVPSHIEAFADLAQRKGAKIILQMGNNWEVQTSWPVKNIMSSCKPVSLPNHHKVFYRQEFNTDVFSYKEPVESREIHNYVNCLASHPDEYNLFLDLEKEMPDYTFKMYGAQNRDGCLTGIQNLADEMSKARWIFHCKPGGDGYGHLLHNYFAVGRPMIVKKRYYREQLAENMIEPHNSLMIDGKSVKEIAQMIRDSESSYLQLSKSMYNEFITNVSFENDAESVQKFLNNLQ